MTWSPRVEWCQKRLGAARRPARASRGSDFTAQLYYDLGDGFSEDQSIAPPISRKGTIHELIHLPQRDHGAALASA
ncbi:MAG: hypothetical protein MZV70_63740 [Desulfobacterales bacterium]|nr:hypothetical protein [Desulfobacterales bacterium]